MPLIAARTVFTVVGISAIVQISRRSAAPPLPFDQPRYLRSASLQIVERRRRLRRLGGQMPRPFAVGHQLGGKAAQRGFRRFVQQQVSNPLVGASYA